ncbi:MAG: DUF971 domain-containing protein [Phycisphaerales bacterium]
MTPPPKKLDLKKDKGLTIEWADGTTSYYSVPYLRKFSPSADSRQLRDEMAKNPLTVLPQGFASAGALTATGAELVGNYALRITFSDGHSTGIYSWDYLREIDPQAVESRKAGDPTADPAGTSAFPRTPIH